MSTYVLVDLNIEDMEVLSEYLTRIPDLISKHGGRYLVRGAEPTVVHGTAEPPQYIVVLEFPSRADVEAFMQAREESGLADIFARGTRSRILVADGA